MSSVVHQVDTILGRLGAPDADTAELSRLSNTVRDTRLWERDPRLPKAFARALIRLGRPMQAYEACREGLRAHPADLELEYLLALALARGKNTSRAADHLQGLVRRVSTMEPGLKVEVLSLAGRLSKDRFAATTDPERRLELASESAKSYEKAYVQAGDLFPGVNAATMWFLSGRLGRARTLARRVLKEADAALRGRTRKDDYWVRAVMGEAHLLLDHAKEACGWYREAVALAGRRTGDIAAMRRNVLLLDAATHGAEDILEVVDPGAVMVFSGHMLDRPTGRRRGASPRFPPEPKLERLLREAIREELRGLRAGVGYTSVSSGSDTVFAEEMLAGKRELHIVLPFDRHDFYATSVDFGTPALSGWRRRCDRVLAATRENLHYATTEKYLGEDTLFDFANTLLMGLGITHAAELAVDPWALVVREPTSEHRVGGARSFADAWLSAGGRLREIDLAALRARADISIRSVSPARPGPARRAQSGKQRRVVKAMLFSDVKNFSLMADEQAHRFFGVFLGVVTKVIAGLRRPPAFRNTWGDGLYLVFDAAEDCAELAMRLLERVEKTDWAARGLPADTTVRMGLHAGPVYPQWDSVIERMNYFGSHVTRAARIEPVTVPGCAYVSEQFAATLAVRSNRAFRCEYVGVIGLAKGYDTCRLYRLVRAPGGRRGAVGSG